MKTILKQIGILLSMAPALFVTTREARAQSSENQKTVNMNPSNEKASWLLLEVSGMSCQAGCANGIDKMLGEQKGILESKTSFADKSSLIRYDQKLLSAERIMKLIEEKGFHAKAKKGE